MSVLLPRRGIMRSRRTGAILTLRGQIEGKQTQRRGRDPGNNRIAPCSGPTGFPHPIHFYGPRRFFPFHLPINSSLYCASSAPGLLESDSS